MKIAGLIFLWAALAVGGMGILLEYKQTPGAAAEAPSTWPMESVVPLDPQRPTLVMMIHPRCPCSRASVSELGRLLTRVGARLNTHVLVVLPENGELNEDNSELADSARKIPGVTVKPDPGGHESRRFGAFTSGQTQVFSPKGVLLFSGGVTPSRGHHGDNRGSAEIERIALATSVEGDVLRVSKVYGCDLNDPKPDQEETR